MGKIKELKIQVLALSLSNSVILSISFPFLGDSVAKQHLKLGGDIVVEPPNSFCSPDAHTQKNQSLTGHGRK